MTSWISDLPEVVDGDFVDETDYNNILNNVRNIYERILSVEAQVGGGIPLNGACLWRGLASQVPAGWHILDGTNGLLNTLGKFMMGASVDGDIVLTGGASTHLHTNQNLPSYSFSHNHSINITTTGTYGIGINDPQYSGSEIIIPHSHQVTGITADSGAHTHTISSTSSNTSLPPYEQLYWIGRIS